MLSKPKCNNGSRHGGTRVSAAYGLCPGFNEAFETRVNDGP